MAGNRRLLLYYLWTALKFVLTVLSLTIVAYVVIALVYSTDEEKRLKEQNALYERIYPTLPSKIDKIGTDLATLAKKDDIIYKDIFHSEPPKDDPMASLGIFFGSERHNLNLQVREIFLCNVESLCQIGHSCLSRILARDKQNVLERCNLLYRLVLVLNLLGCEDYARHWVADVKSAVDARV